MYCWYWHWVYTSGILGFNRVLLEEIKKTKCWKFVEFWKWLRIINWPNGRNSVYGHYSVGIMNWFCWNNTIGSDATHVGFIPKPLFYSTSPLSPLDSLPNRVKRRYSIRQKDHSASFKPSQQTTAPSQPWLQEVRGQWQARLSNFHKLPILTRMRHLTCS